MPNKRTIKTNSKVTRMSVARRKGIFNNRRNRGIAIIVAVLAITGISSIGYALAALSQDLKINGTTTVKGLKWDIHFENLQPVTVTGKAAQTVAPTIDEKKTKIGDYKVTFSQPGDAVQYDFNVKNAGDLNAEITSITLRTGSGLTCTPPVSTEPKSSTVCANLSYTLVYATNNVAVAVGDTLNKDESKQMRLKLKLSDTMALTDMPSTDVEISGLDIVLTYGQKAE